MSKYKQMVIAFLVKHKLRKRTKHYVQFCDSSDVSKLMSKSFMDEIKKQQSES
jgi:hypothetical protein